MMHYEQALSYLKERHRFSPSLITQGKQAFDTRTVAALLEALDQPHRGLRFVHVAGTNGKGSFVAYLSSILQQAGISFGSFTSPYLVQPKEMIRTDGKEISKKDFSRLCARIAQATRHLDAQGIRASEYECLVALAFLYFQEKQCDLVVLETCLGSEGDVTNVIESALLTVLMHIGEDHMELLGDSLEEITRSELGILKPGTVLLSARQDPTVQACVDVIAAEQNVPLLSTEDVQIRSYHDGCAFSYRGKEYQLTMNGRMQAENAAVAIEAATFLQSFLPISPEQIRQGLKQAYWPGRFECIRKEGPVILDGGHNTDCLRALIRDLRAVYPDKKFVWICGMYQDKDIQTMMTRIAQVADEVYTIDLPGPRSADAGTLAALGGGVACAGLDQAFQRAQNRPVCFFGSLSLIPMVREYFDKR